MLYLTWLMQEEEKVKRNYNFEQCITHYLPSPSSPLLFSSPHLFRVIQSTTYTLSSLISSPPLFFPLLLPLSSLLLLSLPITEQGLSALLGAQAHSSIPAIRTPVRPSRSTTPRSSWRFFRINLYCILSTYCASYIILTDWLTTSNSNCPFTFPIITFI